jgi:hypothetical protein
MTLNQPIKWLIVVLAALLFTWIITTMPADDPIINRTGLVHIPPRGGEVEDIDDANEVEDDDMDDDDDDMDDDDDDMDDDDDDMDDDDDDMDDDDDDMDDEAQLYPGEAEGASEVDPVAENADLPVEEVIITHDGYQLYSEDAVKNALAEGKNVALFFHATRCPTCKALEEDILENEDVIDDNTFVFQVDYDSEEELKTRYVVTSQHTVVYLDENMDAVTTTKPNTADELLSSFE